MQSILGGQKKTQQILSAVGSIDISIVYPWFLMVELDHDISMVSHVSFNGEASLYPALVDPRLRPGRPLVALALSGAAESALRMCTVQGEGTPSMGKNMFVNV